MAFLTINGTTVSVATASPSVRRVFVGNEERAFDGTLRITDTAQKQEWRVSTPPLTFTEYNTLAGVITGSATHTVNGDMVNNVSTFARARIVGTKMIAANKSGFKNNLQLVDIEIKEI